MQRIRQLTFLFLFATACTTMGADWRQFRGPDGQGISTEKGLPTEWAADKNIVWRTKLPGAGASSPITLGNRLFITCYSGYAMDTKEPGDQKNLKRHLLCIDRKNGQTVWAKEFDPELPEHKYSGEGSYHGYAANTPITDGERLYVFFGKSGVYCFDLDGKQVWRSSVGKGTNGWGSGASPVLYKNLVIVNASVESGSMVALDKSTGKEVWRVKGVSSAWNTPILVDGDGATKELVISVQGKVLAFDPDTGKDLWWADGVNRYVCPSVVEHKGVVYVTGGGFTTIAIRTGGRGNVNDSHVVWREKKGSNASSPIYHDGHLYWASESGGVVHCTDAATGKEVYNQRLSPDTGRIWASPVLADGKLYYVSQFKGVFVVAAQPKYELVAHNVIADDKSRSNASVAISDGQIFLRTDQNLYCIGKK